MPTYTYECKECEKTVEKFFTSINSVDEVICQGCERGMTKVIGASNFVVKGYNAKNLYGATDKNRRK